LPLEVPAIRGAHLHRYRLPTALERQRDLGARRPELLRGAQKLRQARHRLPGHRDDRISPDLMAVRERRLTRIGARGHRTLDAALFELDPRVLHELRHLVRFDAHEVS